MYNKNFNIPAAEGGGNVKVYDITPKIFSGIITNLKKN